MCLQTVWNKPKITITNKTVYKIMYISGKNEAISEYNDFPYILNKLYACEIKETDDNTSYDSIATDWKIDCYLKKL